MMCDASGALLHAKYSKHLNHEMYPTLMPDGTIGIYCSVCHEYVENLGER